MMRQFHPCRFIFAGIIPQAQTEPATYNAMVNLHAKQIGVDENSRWEFVCWTGMGCNG